MVRRRKLKLRLPKLLQSSKLLLNLLRPNLSPT
jgi:hypothetical protein